MKIYFLITFCLLSMAAIGQEIDETSGNCNHLVCEQTEHIELDLFIPSLARTEYIPNISISQGNEFDLQEQILKVKEFEVFTEATINIDLDNKFNYYIIVIDELIINDADNSKIALTFKWDDKTMTKLKNSLNGKPGADINGQSGRGVVGRSGGAGGNGLTRHSPDIYVFVQKLTQQNSRLKNINFDFDLQGIEGGRGGDGGKGGDGGLGIKGSNGKMTWGGLACKGGQKGKQGGAAGRGGRGGNGSCGGNGPKVDVFFKDIDIANLMVRATYNVNGSELNIDELGWGDAGVAGNPGKGGPGGDRAGNCNGGGTGKEGYPRVGTYQWKNWNYGRGLAGSHGYDGEFDYDFIDNYMRVVFDDPQAPIQN